MDEIKSLIEALNQYNKTLSKQYKNKLRRKNEDIELLRSDLIHEIKKHRWQISNGKNKDAESQRHFEKYFIDREVK